MSKFIAFLGFFILLFITPVIVPAIEIKLEDHGAVVDDDLDDSGALQRAIDAVFEKGGGKVLFPSGRININNAITAVPAFVSGDLKFQGTRGSVVEVSVGADKIAFSFGRLNMLRIEDMIFVGKNVTIDSPDFYDAKYVFHSTSVDQTTITKCQFFGLAVPDNAAVIYFGNTDARISDTQIDGSLALYPGGSVVLAENSRGLTVTRTTFIDYANLHGTFLTKSTALAGTWIKVIGNVSGNANGTRRILIEDSRFDEGAATAIDIRDTPFVDIMGVNVNVNNTSVGRAVFLKNVDHARIEQSWFGYATSVRPALDFDNVKGAEVTALKFGGGVYFLKQYPNIKVGINYCPQCVELDTTPTRTLAAPVKKK